MAISAAMLADCYREACIMDVVVEKPGNVSVGSPGYGMTASDFVRSANASAEELVRPEATLGQRVFGAVAATHDAVGCNTNLGIVLLCAPVIQACQWYPEADQKTAVRKVLDASSVADAEAVFAAVRLASPGGLGATREHDVAGPAQARLVDVMAAAAGHDMIARQYANGFDDLLGAVVPGLERAARRHTDRYRAAMAMYLELLSRFPDTHIQRKHGEAVARWVLRRAEEVRRDWSVSPGSASATERLQDFDRELKESGWNPGTTADFFVAALLSHRLQCLADSIPGVTRCNPRTRNPEGADRAAILNSQVFEGELKWQ